MNYPNVFQVTAVGYNAKAMGANVKIASAMGETTKTMANMNKIMKPEQVARDMQVNKRKMSSMPCSWLCCNFP